MKNSTIYLILVCTTLLFGSCSEDTVVGPPGQDGLDGQNGLDGLDGQNAEVYYSEWFSPTAWSGVSEDWYFEASAPDLTEDIVEGGVILAYVSLAGDIYEGAVRPLPAYAIGANWDFLIPNYGSIVFNCDMIDLPLTSENQFRFVAIPGTIPALKSASTKSEQELRKMSYQEVCKLFGIPE